MDVDAAIQQFIDAMAAEGLSLTEPIQPDGKLHRCSANRKKGDTAGWYVLHVDGVAAGAFGSWREGWAKRWRADIGRALSREEKDAYRARVEAMRKTREAEDARLKAEARTKAAAIWQAAQPAPDKVRDDEVLAPGPGHSAKDRSLSIKLGRNGRTPFVVHPFAGYDWRVSPDCVCKKTGIEWLRAEKPLPRFPQAHEVGAPTRREEVQL